MLAVDTETNGEDIRDGRGYCIGVSLAARFDGEPVGEYLPFRHVTGGNLSKERLAELKTVLEDPTIPKVFHNAKFDIVSLRTLGIEVKGDIYDTMLMAHLINENRPFSFSLNAVCAYYLGKDAANQKDKSEELKKYIAKFGWANIPVPMMRPYAIQDAVLLLKLGSAIYPKFLEENLGDYWKHKVEFLDVIIAMEDLGVEIDVELCKREAAKGEARMQEIIKELGGYSPKTDLKYLLIDKLGLPIYKVSEKTNKPSFDKFAMELYDEDLSLMDNNLAKLVLEYRGWEKSVSSNYRPYQELLSPDGRLRPNYKLHGTKTGRMSCEKPNLQQIPRVSDKPWNGQMKQAFKAKKGYTLWEADYSQLELRLATAYARVDILKQVFREGRDIFTEMALQLGMERYDCKQFVYTTQYGGGIRVIKKRLKVTESRAKDIRENYFSTYPGFKRVSEVVQGTALNHGKVRLWSGRYRHLQNPEKEAHKAFNSVCQGGGADIVERVMVRLYNEVVLPSNGECRMLLQVHDSVVFEIKNGRETHYHKLIHDIMEDVDALAGADSFDVTFKVEIKKWGGD